MSKNRNAKAEILRTLKTGYRDTVHSSTFTSVKECMEYIKITGYKSFKDSEIELKPINILIGANGSGKSNFLSFFEFLNRLYERKLTEYVNLNGGMDRLLHNGNKATDSLSAYIKFDGGSNAYSFAIKGQGESFVFTDESVWYHQNPWDISNGSAEANVKNDEAYRSAYVRKHLESFKKYHFHDTGKNSHFSKTSNIDNDGYFLYEKGENLASYLYNIRENSQVVYNRIVKVIQSIAPYFSDFYFNPNKNNLLRLQWNDKFSSTIYGAGDLSDGTIRFVALTTLFMQPKLPSSIIIDEPELGLHPFAISKLAGMIRSAAAKGTQVIIATQSTDLVSQFRPEEIITVDQTDGESKLNRLDSESLSEWIDDYSLGDLWKRNIIKGAQPK